MKSIYALLFIALTKLLTLDQSYLIGAAVAAPPPRPTVAEIYAMVPTLKRIAACESMGDPNATPRQFNASGTPLWGNDPLTGKPVMKDVGELQIDYIHFPQAESMGLDVINSESDNVYYGYLLYEQFGFSPWTASIKCWGK